MTDQQLIDLLAKMPPLDLSEAIYTGSNPEHAEALKKMKCLNFQTMSVEYKDDPSDNPAADAATQFDVMTKRGFKLNMLKGVYEK